MADNVTLNTGTGGPVMATDEVTIGGNVVHAQRVKNGYGADGTYADVSPVASLPTFRGLPAGYAIRNFIFDTPTASPAAETLMSVVQWYNDAAVAGTTTPAVVPAGKRLCILGMRCATASLAAAGMVRFRLRANTAGVVAVGSPLVATLQVGSRAAVAALQDHQIISFPQGIHFPAGTGIGFTHQGYVGATATLQSFSTFEAWGYEYTV